MNSKFTLALIALVGVGVFALPSTMALFSGQHSFYNIDATGNQVPCQKCHGDVKAELSSGGSSTTGTGGPHANFQCEYCHRAESGFASGDDAYAKITYTNDTTGDQIFLVTTIQNHEQGNFPKTIVWPASGILTVDNWESTPNLVLDNTGNQFYNNTAYLDINSQYAGSLSQNGNANEWYKYDFRDEIPTTYGNGTTKDQLATATTAFNAHNVTWNGINENLNGAGSREVTPGTRYHAASIVSCLECHGGDQNKGTAGYQLTDAMPYNHGRWVLNGEKGTEVCSNCHYGDPRAATGITGGLAAGGFGLTDAADGGNANDTGEVEAHNDFVRGNGAGPNGTQGPGVLRMGYGAINDACVSCHTHVAVDINFQKKYVLKFNANAMSSNTTGHGSWHVGGFSADGTVNVEEFGNQSGGTFATGNHTYNWVVGSTLYVGNNQSAVVNNLNNAASDNQSTLSGGLLP